MTYENAPATKMLATHCMICRKALVDAVSVEAGIGPECRKRHGYNSGNQENRLEANEIIHQIATSDYSPAMIIVTCDKLMELGFNQLAMTVLKRNATIEIMMRGSEFIVKSPYNPEMVAEFRSLNGRASYKNPADRKGFEGFIVSVAKKMPLFYALKAHFPGTLGIGPKGAFIL